MLQSSADAEALMESGTSVLGPGWREIASFEDLSDEDEYTSDEEEIYAVLDFGQAIDRQQLQTESTYQLIGIDTPVPFIKLGNQVYQGELAPLIGDEVILGSVRDPSDPTRPSHPPLHLSSHHIVFRPVTLFPKEGPAPSVADPTDAPVEKAKIGRPKGSTSKPRVIVQSEADVMKMDMGSLPDDVIIEIEEPAIPGAAPVPNRRLTKYQAERLMAGLPASHRRVQDPITGLKIPRKRAGKKDQDGGDAEAGSSTGAKSGAADPKRTASGSVKRKPTPKTKGKGKGKDAEGGPGDHPEMLEGDGDAVEEGDMPGDMPLGSLYLATREPGLPAKPPAKRGRPKKRVDFVTEEAESAGPPDSGTEGGVDDGGERGSSAAAGQSDGGGADDVVMQDEERIEDAASPLMEVDDGGS